MQGACAPRSIRMKTGLPLACFTGTDSRSRLHWGDHCERRGDTAGHFFNDRMPSSKPMGTRDGNTAHSFHGSHCPEAAGLAVFPAEFEQFPESSAGAGICLWSNSALATEMADSRDGGKTELSRQGSRHHERPSERGESGHLVSGGMSRPATGHQRQPSDERFYGWAGDHSILAEMRDAAASVHGYSAFTRARELKCAYCLRPSP